MRVGISTQRSDGILQLTAMAERGDAKLLEVLRRQVRQNRLINLIFAEDRLVLPEAQRSQTTRSITGAPIIGSGTHHDPAQSGCPGSKCAADKHTFICWGNGAFPKLCIGQS